MCRCIKAKTEGIICHGSAITRVWQLKTPLYLWIPGGWSPGETVRATVQQTCGLHHKDILSPGPQLLFHADPMPGGGCGTSPLHCENIPLYG